MTDFILNYYDTSAGKSFFGTGENRSVIEVEISTIPNVLHSPFPCPFGLFIMVGAFYVLRQNCKLTSETMIFASKILVYKLEQLNIK